MEYEALQENGTKTLESEMNHNLIDQVPKQMVIFIGTSCAAVVFLVFVIVAVVCQYRRKLKYKYADVKRVIVMQSVS